MSSDPEPGAPEVQLRSHVPVEVVGNLVRVGAATRGFRPGNARSLLTAYLALIRGLRDQRRARTIEVRSADVESLAAYLGLPGNVVVERLAELMGATRAQRASMVTLFGAGALVIGLAGSTAVGRAQQGPADRVEPVATVGVREPVTPAATMVPSDAPGAVVGPSTSVVAVPTAAPAAVPVPASAPARLEEPPTIIDQPAPTTVDPAPAPSSGGAPTTTEPEVTDIGTPPIPPATEPPADTVVTDIGTPPIPPSSTAPDDTPVTDIGTPPIPPTTAEALAS